jgi:hypothetical protein
VPRIQLGERAHALNQKPGSTRGGRSGHRPRRLARPAIARDTCNGSSPQTNTRERELSTHLESPRPRMSQSPVYFSRDGFIGVTGTGAFKAFAASRRAA